MSLELGWTKGVSLFKGGLVFEIAVDRQAKTRDLNFEGSRTPTAPVPAVQPRPYLINFWRKYTKSPQHAQNQNYYGWLTCSWSSQEHVYEFYTDWTTNG